MKHSKLMLIVISALLLSVAAWAQSSTDQSSSSAQTSNGQAASSAQSSTSGESSANGVSNSGTQSSSNPQSSATNEGSAGTGSGASLTLRGCVTGGAGTYVLNSKDGTAYTLLGDGPALDKQINHEVAIIGTRVAAPAGSQPDTHQTQAGAPGHPSGNNIQVSQMHEIADHCATPK